MINVDCCEKMEAQTASRVRVCLHFDKSIESSWLLIDFLKIKTIKDLQDLILCRFYDNASIELKLSMCGCSLPSWERSEILCNNDHLKVETLDSVRKQPLSGGRTSKQMKRKRKVRDACSDFEESSIRTKNMDEVSYDCFEVLAERASTKKITETGLAGSKKKAKKLPEEGDVTEVGITETGVSGSKRLPEGDVTEVETTETGLAGSKRKQKRLPDGSVTEVEITETGLAGSKRRKKKLLIEGDVTEVMCLDGINNVCSNSMKMTDKADSCKKKKQHKRTYVTDSDCETSVGNKDLIVNLSGDGGEEENTCGNFLSRIRDDVDSVSLRKAVINPVSKMNCDRNCPSSSIDVDVISAHSSSVSMQNLSRQKRRHRKRKKKKNCFQEQRDGLNCTSKYETSVPIEIGETNLRKYLSDCSLVKHVHFSSSESELDTNSYTNEMDVKGSETGDCVRIMTSEKHDYNEREESLPGKFPLDVLMQISVDANTQRAGQQINDMPMQSLGAPMSKTAEIASADGCNFSSSSVKPSGGEVVHKWASPKSSTYPELSKGKQLNTTLINRSLILQNPAGSNPLQEITYTAIPLDKDYSKFPLLHGPPRPGDIIAYKILELSADYTPQISNYKEAAVLNFDSASMKVELEHINHRQKKKRAGKFDLVVEGEEEILTNIPEQNNRVIIEWSSLCSTKLLQSE